MEAQIVPLVEIVSDYDSNSRSRCDFFNCFPGGGSDMMGGVQSHLWEEMEVGVRVVSVTCARATSGQLSGLPQRLGPRPSEEQ